MLSQLIEACLNNRLLVVVFVALIAVGGAYHALVIPIDAVPDMTNVQVQIITDAGSLSPLEVEQYITYPVEATMGGLPRTEEIRSVSKLGLSVVTVVFKEGTDIFHARNLVNERLAEAKSRIGDYGDPQIGPLTTALGEILQFEVRSKNHSPMELRTILEWEIAPRLRETVGVTEVNSMGGYYKSFEIQIDPNRLAEYGLVITDVIDALEQTNISAGGGYLVHHGEQRFVRGQALLQSIADIEQVVVETHDRGVPVLIKDLGAVAIAPVTRQGAVTRDARGEIVTGMVMMQLGANSRTVVDAAKSKLDEIQDALPPGVTVEVIYDRAELINRTLHTVMKNLLEGGTLVIVILFLMLGNFRAGVIVALAIPLSMMFATNLMAFTAISASLMSLGAIDFGLIVDSSVIMIENCMRHIAHYGGRKSHMEIIRDAAIEVRGPTMFGELIIAVVYLPILFLQGTEGKLFRPMALTVLFALCGSLVLSLTLMPVLAYMGLPRRLNEKDVWLVRLVKWIYHPLVALAVRHPVVTLGGALALVTLCVPVALNMGAEFMPRLDEGDLLVEALRLPSASLEGSVPMATQIESILTPFPEVKTVFCKTGRPEIANDVMGVHQTDVWVLLHPPQDWPEPKTRDELIEEMSAKLSSQVPGVAFGFTQPIEMRVDELVAGVKADVAVLLYGDDIETLAAKGKEIERTLKGIPGAVDVKADYQANIPTLSIRAKPEQLALYGVTAHELMETVASIGGREVGQIYEGRARFPMMVRLPEIARTDVGMLERVPVKQLDGQPITIGELADLRLEESPPGIEHESGRRRTFISVNVRNRDVASFVQEAQQRVREQVSMPSGYAIEWGGDFENLESASLRLAIITPFVLLLIWLLLFMSFKSMRLAALIFMAVPIAACGGVLALTLRGMPFSISAGVGFIALFGVAVLNGLVWVSGAEQLRAEGKMPRIAAYETAMVRIRPVLMTALVASFGFLPMALATTAGAEIQRPLATVVIGGLVTSTLLTAFVVPAIYPWFAPTVAHRSSDIPKLVEEDFNRVF
ncbi:MAG: efflux RND transporter permease subunit [Planctomycetales bacterium]|nr:efflux RND transporter permease subunit [Planctomycetales bacterium]